MTNDPRSDAPNRDGSIFSGYLNRWVAVIVFSAIIALAAGALLVDSNDLAHRTVVVGVAAYDSARSDPALASFAAWCRAKGCGDLSWRYLPPRGPYEGCDFYIVPALSAARMVADGVLECSIIVAEREAHRYSRSVIIVRHGAPRLPDPEWRVVFSAPVSAAGWLSPYRALAGARAAPRDSAVFFAGERPRDERVVLAVLYGAYDAGGVSLERLEALEETGVFSPDEIDVALEGEAVPEVLVVASPSRDDRGRRQFVRTLIRTFDQSPALVRRDLRAIGMAGMYEPRPEDLERLASLVKGLPGPAAAAGIR